MKILHILNDGDTKLADEIVRAQAKRHEVKVIDLSNKRVSYESIVDDIFLHDKVISW